MEEALTMEEQIASQLESVIDPELGIDIVNLGLVYEVGYKEPLKQAYVLMTLTTIGCPLIDVIADDVHNALKQIDGVDEVDLEITFDPPWTVDNMSRYARIALGIG
ncbi:metal-sulfur cluster assembly factor [Suicoccus acidiformans]|nr:metal-sulfur cluster assembly factor [Suicoccus acidiformans]